MLLVGAGSVAVDRVCALLGFCLVVGRMDGGFPIRCTQTIPHDCIGIILNILCVALRTYMCFLVSNLEWRNYARMC